MYKYCINCGSPLDKPGGICPRCTSKNKGPNPPLSQKEPTMAMNPPLQTPNANPQPTPAKKPKKLARSLIACVVAIAIFLSGISVAFVFNRNRIKTMVDRANANFISLALEALAGYKVTDQTSALNAVCGAAKSAGLLIEAENLRLQSMFTMDGTTYYRFGQYYNGIPVYGKEAILAAGEDGEAKNFVSNLTETEEPGGDSHLSDEEGKQAIEDQVEKEDEPSSTPNNPDVVNPQTVDLLYTKGLHIYNLDRETPVWAHSYIARTPGGIYEFVVSANRPRVLAKLPFHFYNTKTATAKDTNGNRRTFNTTKTATGQYQMRDTTRNLVVYNAESQEFQYTMLNHNEQKIEKIEDLSQTKGFVFKKGGVPIAKPESSNGKTWNAKAVQLMANLTSTYDFYNNVLKIKGTNGQNNTIHAVFNDAMAGNQTDAYLGGEAAYYQNHVVFSFGSQNPLTVDAIAHEYAHGVEQTVSGLWYYGESGAVMEAVSDIFGELAEDYAINTAMKNKCDWHQGDRTLNNPTASSYPALYGGEFWVDPESKEDFGGIHQNSTVLSHAAYLMSNGINGTQENKIQGKTLASLWFTALQLFPKNVTFAQCAALVTATAKNMNLTAPQLACVEEAFAKVGLGTNLVQQGAPLTVLDEAGNPYQGYRLVIENLQTGNTVVETTVNKSKPYDLDLDIGFYRLTVTDGAQQGSKTAYTKTFTIVPFVAEEYTTHITLNTDFVSPDGNQPPQEKPTAPVSTIWQQVPNTFQCASYGGWDEEITIADDGSFTGNWSDFNRGETGPNYPNGTRHSFDYKGKFTNEKQLDEFSYSLEMESRWVLPASEPNSIKDGIRYVYDTDVDSTPPSTLYYLFLPGTPISQIEAKAVGWNNNKYLHLPENTTHLPQNTYILLLGDVGYCATAENTTQSTATVSSQTVASSTPKANSQNTTSKTTSTISPLINTKYYLVENSSCSENCIPYVIFKNDGTFYFEENLYEGMGHYTGTYKQSGKNLTLTVTYVSFNGAWVGDDVRTIRMTVINQNKLQLHTDLCMCRKNYHFAPLG